YWLLSLSLPRSPPRPPLFPYTTLFRSGSWRSDGRDPRWRDGGRTGPTPRVGGPDVRRGVTASDGSGARSCPTSAETPDRKRPCSDRKSTRLNSSHDPISYAVFCLKKKK